jgi:pimeloyl-ACP methyl ester carboxylesterase
VSAGGLRYDRFRVNGHDEWLMRVGPEDGPAVLFVPPLFEEMNRTRALLAAVMRELANKGFCCTLPDLPGTGESERALQTCGWADWRRRCARSTAHRWWQAFEAAPCWTPCRPTAGGASPR